MSIKFIMSNFFGNLKTTISNASENIARDLLQTTPTVTPPTTSSTPLLTSSLTSSTPLLTPSSTPLITTPPTSPPIIANFEKSLDNAYVGCFRDNPNNSKLSNNLGKVTNQLECITKGKKAGMNYIALKNGSECYGSLTRDFMENPVERSFCDVPCTDQGTGNCGGNHFTQAYLIDKKQDLEHFTTMIHGDEKFYWIILFLIILFLLV